MRLMCVVGVLLAVALGQPFQAQSPVVPNKVESPTVKVLTG